jgi:transcription antitermination factor NusG
MAVMNAMISATSATNVQADAASLCKFRWYAGQTRSRHEKCVADQMDRRGIDHFLPLYEKVSRWKDRRVRLQLPLFPGYIFICILLHNQLEVLQIPGVTRLVSFCGHPAELADDEIVALQRGLASGIALEPHPFLKVGQRVRVHSGPLAGLSGHLLRKKQQNRIVISIDSILRAFTAEISLDDVEIPKRF